MGKIYKKIIQSTFMLLAVGLSYGVNGQYCTPSGTNSSYGVDNFSTTGGIQNITNFSSGFSPNGYGDFTAMTVEQEPGSSVNFSASFLGAGSTYGFRIWVDWDQNGSFDANEVVFSSSGYEGSHSGTFEVPLAALPGFTRMRIVAHWLDSQGNIDPCTIGHTYGEFEDYTFEVTGLESCDGPPEAGVINQDTNFEVCGNVPLSLSVSGATIAGDLTRQWQKREPEGDNEWVNIPNAIGYGVTVSINTPTDFRFVITCEATLETDISDVVSATIKPATECYCFPSNSTNMTYYIDGVTTEGALTNLYNVGSGFSPGGYIDYTETDTLRVYPGQTFSFTLTHPDSYSYGYGIWVDWDEDGSFDQVGDLIYNSGSYVNSPIQVTVQIPNNAPLTSTRLRIRANYLSTSPQPCGEDSYTEAEDYTITIVDPPTCLPPLNGILMSQTSNSAKITWVEQNSGVSTWNIEYGLAGFTMGTGTLIEGVTENPYTLTGLDDNTVYDIYVQTDCGNDDESFWMGPIRVHTDCLTMPIPFLETYEDNSNTINCWTNEHVVGNKNWTIGTGSSGGSITSAYQGTKNAVFVGTSGTHITKFISPTLDMSYQDSVMLVFAYGQQNWGTQNELKVYARTEDDDDWIELNHYPYDVSEWKTDTLMIAAQSDAFSGNELKLAFEGINDYGYANVLDNIEVFPCSGTAGQGGNASICRTEGSLDLNTVATIDATWGEWYFPDNQSLINGSSFNITTLPSGQYDIYYILDTPCMIADTATVNVTIYNQTSSGEGSTMTVCKGQSFQLLEGLSGNFDSGGDWYDYNGTLLGSTQQFAPEEAGTYDYMYLTSNGVCPIDTAVVTIIVPEDCDDLSVNDEMFNQISVYPNPTENQLNISNSSNIKSLNIEILDLNGRVVLTENKALQNATGTVLEIGKLSKGIYSLRIYNNEGQRIFKIVKQ